MDTFLAMIIAAALTLFPAEWVPVVQDVPITAVQERSVPLHWCGGTVALRWPNSGLFTVESIFITVDNYCDPVLALIHEWFHVVCIRLWNDGTEGCVYALFDTRFPR